MKYEEFSPTRAVVRRVRCYWELLEVGGQRSEVSDDLPATQAEPALPDGSPELIFNLGDPFEHVGADGVPRAQPLAMLVGQITAPMTVRPSGRVHLVGVRFEAHGAALLHDDLGTITDRWIDASDLAGGQVGQWLTALRDASSTDERTAILDAALEKRSAGSTRIDPRVEQAALAIRAGGGATSIDELAERLGVTTRTLQRLFAKQVGITPKLLARIVRFQRIFAAWRSDPRSLARVAVECGYFDQSHLVRDFRDFAGAPPAGFLAELPAFTAFFTA